jgi:hypothetical protein
LSAPAPQSGCAGGRYHLKRKSVSGNSIRSRGGPRRGTAHGCTIPLHPDPLPPWEGGRGCREWGDVIPTNAKRAILSAPAPQSGCAEGWYRLKRKSVSGNSIIPFPVSGQSRASGAGGVEKGGLFAALQSEGLRRGEEVVFADEISHALHWYRCLFFDKILISTLDARLNQRPISS